MAPLVVTAMFGMIEVGYCFMIRQTVTLASREGCRAAALPGGTMTEAIIALKKLGAREVYCCASHALLSGPAIDRFSASPVTEVAVTNTILVPPGRTFDRLKILSIAPLLSQAIRYTHSDQSVSSLFD